VETGFYDTSPFPAGDGFEGCWGVYPYFSNGVIVASDRQEGLFVLQPDEQRAAYLEGVVTNTATGAPVFNASVEIMGTEAADATNLFGQYKTGVADSGRYDVRVIAPRCLTQIVTGVVMDNSLVTQLNVALSCSSTGTNESKDITEFFIHYDPEVVIHYNFPETGKLQLLITDMSGRTFYTRSLSNQEGVIRLDQELPSGMYVATLFSPQFSTSKKMFINR
jgi:hypothetical protein